MDLIQNSVEAFAVRFQSFINESYIVPVISAVAIGVATLVA